MFCDVILFIVSVRYLPFYFQHYTPLFLEIKSFLLINIATDARMGEPAYPPAIDSQ